MREQVLDDGAQGHSCSQIGSSLGRGEDSTDDETSSDDDLLDRTRRIVPIRQEKARGSEKTAAYPEGSFGNLSHKLRQILKQGGSDFATFFEPMSLEVTTKAELYSLLNYWKEGQRVIQVMCRTNALKVSHDKNRECFQPIRAPLLRPDRRANADLSFPPEKRIATRELRRWMQKGSIIPFVETLESRAGPVDKDNSDAYLAREIKCTGMALAAFLDEFHPNPIIYSSGIERLVRRLVVIEAALEKDKKDRGAFYEKNLSFLGIGGGASPAARQELAQ